MKKLFLFFVIVIILFLTSIYIIIPSNLHVSESVQLHSSVGGTFRNLTTIQDWKKWWPDKESLKRINKTDTGRITFNKDTFIIEKQLYNDLTIVVRQPKNSIQTTMLFVPLNKDTFAINWLYDVKTSMNPFARISIYNQAKKTKEKFAVILDSIRTFFNESKNVYGVAIVSTSTKDTLLITTSRIIENYPTTHDVYNMIKQLQNYLQNKKTDQTGAPMLNISAFNKREYKVMVALPVNKVSEPTKDIINKRMVAGEFLVTIVQGGDSSINTATAQMQQYFIDHHRTPAALPFQILVTDRMKESDTAKWTTKLYFPVMN